MGLLEKPQSRPHDVGNLAASHLDLEFHRVVVGAIEDGDILEVPSLVDQLEDASADKFGLLVAVAQFHEGGLHSGGAVGPERLLELMVVVANREVRESEDLGRRAVVDLELVGLAVLVAVGKLQDVAIVGAPEGIDALAVVAHHRQVAVTVGEHVDDLRLDVVGVVVFVDEDVLEAL